jgi:serine/threonine protein kinase
VNRPGLVDVWAVGDYLLSSPPVWAEGPASFVDSAERVADRGEQVRRNRDAVNPEQWQRVKEIVGAALERGPEDRGAFLDEACLQDGELRAEVESLLAAHGDAGALSENPWEATVADAVGESQVVGPYHLVRRLGVGGMGQVWLGEQLEPVRRRVALKLIKAGMYDGSLLQRFQAERQSLAIMDHPAIARVFDAGTTSAGQPYFAMEYVDGPAITDYCDRKKLGIRERLRLFLQVCNGVQHAHQKAIIHRDLKPSNILVAEVDGKPVPRIIDFGLAKATQTALPAQALFTQVGAFLGTPGYMSPEQAEAGRQDVDTRTDVYSLGVVLYELLTGFLPFDAADWKKRRLDEVLRQLREADPEPPSTKVSKSRTSSAAHAEARATETEHLTNSLRGDLDCITMKALEKDRERRYGTPSALAGDVERYLENRPVEARPAAALDRLSKYVRRHAVGVGVASGAAALLLVFAVTQSIELRRITRERDRADRVTEFMTRMFKVSDPSEARGASITARELLDKSSKDIDAGLARDPELKGQMLDLMGNVYEELGLYPRAESLLKQAVDVRRSVLGPEHPGTLSSARLLAWTTSEEGRYEEAERMLRQLVSTDNRVLGPDDRRTLAAESTLAWTLELTGHFADAEKLSRQTLERQQHALGMDDPDTIETARCLAVVLEKQGRFKEAEERYRLILDARRRVLGPEHPRTLKIISDLGIVLVEEDRYTEAEPLLQQTLDLQSRVLGRDHPDTILTMGNLATVFENEGRNAESEKLQREVLAQCRRVFGPEHPSTAIALYNVADVLYEEHRYSEAATFLRQAVDIERRVLGAGHPDTVGSVYKLARLLALTKKPDEAIVLLRDAVVHGLDAETIAGMEKDEALKSLHGKPAFDALVAQARTPAAAAEQKN